MTTLRNLLSCAALLAALTTPLAAVAAAPVVKKVVTTTQLAPGKVVVPKLPTPGPGLDSSLMDIAGAMSVKETELGQRVTLTAAAPKVGETWMRLIDPRDVDPSGPRVDFYADGNYGKGFATAMYPIAVAELHFLAKSGKSYFIECDATTSDTREWILGRAKPLPSILATTFAQRPMFVYTASANGDTALHFSLKQGEWSLSKCQITPVA